MDYGKWKSFFIVSKGRVTLAYGIISACLRCRLHLALRQYIFHSLLFDLFDEQRRTIGHQQKKNKIEINRSLLSTKRRLTTTRKSSANNCVSYTYSIPHFTLKLHSEIVCGIHNLIREQRHYSFLARLYKFSGWPSCFVRLAFYSRHFSFILNNQSAWWW